MGMERGACYGTFEGQQSGFPQPSAPPIPGPYNAGGQPPSAVPGYPVLGNYPGPYQGSGSYYQGVLYQGSNPQTCHHHCEHASETRPLPFFGLGFGWFLFLVGFFFLSFPWYIGVGIFLFMKYDPRERSGLIACCMAALIFFFFSGVSLHLHARPGAS